MPFTDQEYFEVIEKNEIVKKAFDNIKQICIDLQKQTNCPEEDLKDFLYFIKTGNLVEFPAGFYCEWEITKSIKKHYRLGS